MHLFIVGVLFSNTVMLAVWLWGEDFTMSDIFRDRMIHFQLGLAVAVILAWGFGWELSLGGWANAVIAFVCLIGAITTDVFWINHKLAVRVEDIWKQTYGDVPRNEQ